jgi:hypothetical protein
VDMVATDFCCDALRSGHIRLSFFDHKSGEEITSVTVTRTLLESMPIRVCLAFCAAAKVDEDTRNICEGLARQRRKRS